MPGTVTLYGASDDLIEVEGDVSGCDEYNADDEHFVLIGLEAKVTGLPLLGLFSSREETR